MFKTRLISGIVLLTIIFAAISSGGPVLFGLMLLLSLLGTGELMKAMEVDGGAYGLLEFVTFGILLVYEAAVYAGYGRFEMPILIGGLVLIMFVYVFTYPRYRAEQITGAFFSLVYGGVMLFYVYQTRMLENGHWLVWLIFLSSWGCDTCAYCVGVLFGRHKMAPILSPKKSVEGAMGGLVGAAALGAVYALAVKENPAMYAGICFLGAMISMVGDLAASAIKRNFDIKDYGNLIPGHGGVMDRFDSVIFTAPVIFYLSAFFSALLV